MRILGIDPGVARVGFGLLDKLGHEMKAVQYGVIETPAHTNMEDRLYSIYESCVALIDRFEPKVMAIEKLFFNTNVTTALNVGQARGVLLLAGRQRGLSIVEYTPLQVKQAIVGYGQAEKRQVQEMVRRLLHLQHIPKPDDAADALAIAICQAHAAPWPSALEKGGRS